MQNKNKNKNKKAGYTIIETMIAVSIFIIIIMIGMEALLNANLLHNKSQNMRSIMDNLSFVMEDMSRNLRTGYNYHCLILGQDSLPTSTMSNPKSCLSGGWGIAFESASGATDNNDDQWIYYINNGKIFKSTQGPSDLFNFIQLTPDEVVIDPVNSDFSVLGAEPPPSNNQQPFVTIRLVGKINFKGVETPFSLQTSVSQRAIDIGN